jgi:threonine dehydratase
MSTPSLDNIKEAYALIERFVHKTPIMTCSTLDELASTSEKTKKLFFKCENFQKVGAFKYRGAMNAVLNLPKEQAKKGVVTHSSGNHAQALALAAKTFGIDAYIVMPNNSPMVKQNAVKGYDGKVLLCEPTLKAREDECAKIMNEKGATLIHPYNNFDVICGQGTIAIELMEQMGKDGKFPFDAVLAPIGGGGLMSGVSTGVKSLDPRVRVFGAEPEAANDAQRSLKEGKLIVHETTPKTIADGLLTSMGSLTWPIVQKNVEEIFTVSDEQVVQAMKLMWERMKIVIEPSSAVSVAVALYNEKFRALDIERIVIVISGGNVDLTKLPF